MKKLSKKLLALLLVFAMLVPTGSLVVNTSASTVSIPAEAKLFNGHYYKVFDESMTWKAAKAYCENLGGYLATIVSLEEQNFIISIAQNTEKTQLWLGGTDEQEEGNWKWITGEEFNYQNWHPSNFDNFRGRENYLTIFTKNTPYESLWNDFANIGYIESDISGLWYKLEQIGFVCEWESAGDVSGEYYIYGKKFNKNIDYYTDYNTSKCSSSDYNAELANMTAALSAAVYNQEEIKKAYFSLGFNEVSLCDYDEVFNPMSSGCAIGFKKSDYGEDTICLVVVRGSKNVADWIGNFSILTIDNGKHVGFSYPAERICNNITKLINDKNISGNIKYVITGHSRGAGVANLLAVKLMEQGVNPTNVYNYNFACPDVACLVLFHKYSNIFNLCNREDVVPFVPGNLASVFTSSGTSWGKYGQTYWFTKDAEDTIFPFADHDMDLYLEFFDQQKMPEEWGRSFWDKVDDIVYWTTGVIVKFKCPVDVIVKDADGNKIASVIGGEVNYYDSSFGDVIIFTDGDKKIIFVSGDNDFNVELIGTDDGTMTYSVEKCNLATEEISESKTFENVKLEKGKEMYSPVSNAETTEDVELFVVENKNGEYVTTHTISTDGTETEIYHIYEIEVVKPTCTEKGYTNHVCLNCDDSYKDTYVDATGHSDTNHDGVCDVCADDFSKNCSCNCHGNAFMQFIHKILCFIYKLFGMTQYQYCDCGKAHW